MVTCFGSFEDTSFRESSEQVWERVSGLLERVKARVAYLATAATLRLVRFIVFPAF